MPRVELTGGYGVDSASQFNAQECVNMYVEASESASAKGRASLKSYFGQEYVDSCIMDHGDPSTEFSILGTHEVFSETYENTFVFTQRFNGTNYIMDVWYIAGSNPAYYTNYGSVTLSGEAFEIGFSAADNGRVIFLETLVGSYFINIETGTRSITAITDPDYMKALDITYKDSYFIWISEEVGEPRMYISDNFATNPTNFVNALDYTTLESNTDRSKAITTLGNEVVVFGSRSIEFYYNSGNVDFPFERNSGVSQSIGVSDKGNIAKINDEIYFTGTAKSGNNVIYRLSGYKSHRESTHAIERLMKDLVSLNRSKTYQVNGNYFYSLSFASGGEYSELLYNISSNKWSGIFYQFGVSVFDIVPHLSDLLYIGLSDNTLELSKLSEDVYTYIQKTGTTTYNNVPLRKILILPHITSENKNIQINYFEMDIQKGVGNVDDPDPEITLTISRDGGMTYGNPITLKMGTDGSYKQRVRADMLGCSRDTVFKIESNSPVQQEWFTAYIDYEVMSE